MEKIIKLYLLYHYRLSPLFLSHHLLPKQHPTTPTTAFLPTLEKPLYFAVSLDPTSLYPQLYFPYQYIISLSPCLFLSLSLLFAVSLFGFLFSCNKNKALQACCYTWFSGVAYLLSEKL